MFACLYIPPLAGSRGLQSSGVRLQPDLIAGLRPSDDDRAYRSDLERASRGDLAALAREFSPRVEVHGPGLVTLDAHGLERLFGDANHLGEELRRAAADRGLHVRIAIASTRTVAWLLAHARAGLIVVAPDAAPAWVSPLPLRVLEQLAASGLGPAGAGRPRAGGPSAAAAARHASEGVQQVASLVALLKRWGLATLGDFGRLPPLDLSARLGQQGLAWQQVARGEEMTPLVPDTPEERFEETLELEWPIEGLQPLSFVFGRVFDALSAHLHDRDRAAAVLHIHLQLVTRAVERRSLQLPAPTSDARVLRTLALLNLEAHPVGAGIDRVTVVADPVPGRVIQCSLLTRALPLPEQLSTLLARLGAVMGDGRCGAATLVDSHRPGAFAMQPFSADWHKAAVSPQGGLRTPDPGLRTTSVAVALRRFRIPIAASVAVKDGRPARVVPASQALRGGGVEACVGPWRTSGEWWRVADARLQLDATNNPGLRTPDSGPRTIGWNRDEWDVNLADGGVYRIYRDRDRDRWFVDGVID
jgi:protein ImuB